MRKGTRKSDLVKIDRANLEKYIKQSRKSQARIAREAGFNEAYFSRFKKADTMVDYESAEKLRAALGYPQAHLFYEFAPRKPLGSFTPTPPVREEAEKAFYQHKADKNKVRENLNKLTGAGESEVLKLRIENARLRGIIEGVKMMIEGRKA